MQEKYCDLNISNWLDLYCNPNIYKVKKLEIAKTLLSLEKYKVDTKTRYGNKIKKNECRKRKPRQSRRSNRRIDK